MKEIQFKEKDWGILTMGIMWTNLYCPYCKKYHSNSFLFDVEKDKTEYIGECEICHENIKIIIDKDKNNALLEAIIQRGREALAGKNSPLTNFKKYIR